MNIRKATIEDMNQLIRLRFDFLEGLMDMTSEQKAIIHIQLEAYYHKHINEDFIAILGEVDNRVVSTAYLAIAERPANPSFITGKTATLLNVFTYPEYRRRGYGVQIVNRIIDEAKTFDVSVIELSATEEGRGLYEKIGFVEKQTEQTQMKLQLIL